MGLILRVLIHKLITTTNCVHLAGYRSYEKFHSTIFYFKTFKISLPITLNEVLKHKEDFLVSYKNCIFSLHK